jgi:hypothetical protein
LKGLALHLWQGRKLLIQRGLLGGSSAQTTAAFSSSPFPLFPGKESSELSAILTRISRYFSLHPQKRGLSEALNGQKVKSRNQRIRLKKTRRLRVCVGLYPDRYASHPEEVQTRKEPLSFCADRHV